MRALAYRTETVIRRSPEEVFDFCSDLRSELRWNPKAKYVEKLTDGPVGVGTRYRARWANSGPTTVEVVQFDQALTAALLATANSSWSASRTRITVTATALQTRPATVSSGKTTWSTSTGSPRRRTRAGT